MTENIFQESQEEKEYFSALESGEEVTPIVTDDDPPESEGADDEKKSATEVKPEGEEKIVEEQPEQKQKRVANVSFGAMHAEREKRKAAEGKVAELEARLEAMEKSPPKPAPNKDEDPDAYRDWEHENTKRELAEAKQVKERAEAREREEGQRARIMSHYQEHVPDFAREHPDFDAVLSEASNLRGRELVEYQDYSHAEAQEQITREQLWLAATAMQKGVNPAKYLYDYIKTVRYPGIDSRVKQRSATDEKMRTIEKGQAASKTVSKAGGSPKGDLTLKDVAGMDGEEFDRSFAKLFPQSAGPRF